MSEQVTDFKPFTGFKCQVEGERIEQAVFSMFLVGCSGEKGDSAADQDMPSLIVTHIEKWSTSSISNYQFRYTSQGSCAGYSPTISVMVIIGWPGHPLFAHMSNAKLANNQDFVEAYDRSSHDIAGTGNFWIFWRPF